MKSPHKPMSRGFTLVELLVVIAIVAVLATLSFVGSRRFIENGKKVQAMAQFRDFQTGLALFETDYTKPPIPKSKRDTGWDTIYGDPGGNYTTQFLVSALAGEDKDYPYKGNAAYDTIVVKRIDDNTYEGTLKGKGKATMTSRNVISKDGKTRTQTQTGTDAQGKAINNTVVYDRQ